MSAESDARDSVISLLDHLEHLITAGKRVPFTSGILVNEEETLEIIDRARLNLPEEVVRAHQSAVDREQVAAAAVEEAEGLVESARTDADTVVARATKEGEALVKRATEKAERLVNVAQQRVRELSAEHAIVDAAQERASQLLAEADERAREITTEADSYARDVMEKLEEQLQRTVTTVRRGIESLPSQGSPRKRRQASRE